MPEPGYVDSFWLMDLPPFSTPETLLLFVGVPLPDLENSVRSWREGSLYMATAKQERAEHQHGPRAAQAAGAKPSWEMLG